MRNGFLEGRKPANRRPFIPERRSISAIARPKPAFPDLPAKLPFARAPQQSCIHCGGEAIQAMVNGFTVLWCVAGIIITIMTALGLNRWRSEWTHARRALISIAASTTPVIGITAFLLASLHDPFSLILTLDPDEFLVPFGFQILVSVFSAAPLGWWISRIPRAPHLSETVFE